MQASAPVFDVQRFTLHDGPGIRSLVFLKGCALHCPWCQNPESQAVKPVIAFYEGRCTESFDCAAACPHDAINRDGFRIDQSRCDQCAKCVDACAYEALRLIGETLTAQQLMDRVMVDHHYYESSGGGVTFTGGEATLHHEFMRQVLEACRQEGIHTNLETAGTFSWAKWNQTLRLLDLIYFDLKIMNADLHAEHLGPGYHRIIENARLLVEHDYPVEFRMALIPGFTDTPENIDGVLDLLSGLGRGEIHLLAYHDLGETKIDIIQGKQPKLGLSRYSDDEWRGFHRLFEHRGIKVLNKSSERR